MKTIDMRFDIEMLKSFLGKTLRKYKCDEFVFTNSVSQIVGLYIGDEVLRLSNIQEFVDYFGVEDDISVFRLESADDSEIVSAFEEKKQIETPIDDIIDEIVLINENQQVFETGIQTYDVWLTRGIIFKVGGREISFEKENVPFSEEIVINRGYELIKKFSGTEAFSEGWKDGIIAVAKRNIIIILNNRKCQF